MPTCKDCKFYTSIDELKGECFNLGFEVRAKTDSKKCPEKAFRSARKNNVKGGKYSSRKDIGNEY